MVVGAPAHAQSTTTYIYDAQGRLIGFRTSGGPTNGLATDITLDLAGNRTGHRVTGAVNGGGAGGNGGVTVPLPRKRVIVVPLNGFTIIPIGS